MRDMSTSCQNRGAHQQNRPMRPFVSQELSQPMGPEFRKPGMSLRCCRFDRELVELIPENERRAAVEEVGRMAEEIAVFATERAARTAEIARRAAGEVPRRAAEAARMAAEEEEARNRWGQVILNARPNESRVWS